MYDMENNIGSLAQELAAPSLSDSAGSREHRPTNAVEDLMQRSQERREQQIAEPDRFVGAWFDPDPEAIAVLPTARHPLMRLLADTRETRREHSTNDVIRTLAFLKGVSTKEVTWEDTLAYPWHHVGPDEAEAFRRKIHSGYSNPHTRQNYVATLRTIMRRCKEAKLISAARYAEVVETLPTAAVRAPARNRRRLTSAEIEALMAACRQDIVLRAARDSAIIALFATTGMRVSELVRLDLAHWDRVNERLTLILTKNGGDHSVPVDERVRVYLEEWLVFRGEDPGPLFVQAAGTSNELAALERFAVRGVIGRVKEIAERAGIGRVGTHDFRRTVASTLLRTTDAALVGRLLNHANLATTLGYDMATEEEQRNAIRSLPLPLLGPELNVEEEAS